MIALWSALLLSLLACSTVPDWTQNLPGTTPANNLSWSQIVGVWRRPVESRFGVANPAAHSVGREEINILPLSADATDQSALRYVKTHLYLEQVEGERTFEAYRESGTIEYKGDWFLFIPVNAMYYRRSGRAEELARYSEADANRSPSRTDSARFNPTEFDREVTPGKPALRLPADINNLKMRMIDAPAPLLYFMKAYEEEIFLTPLTYERLGQTFSHGIYEGSERAYDQSSDNFRKAWEVYNVRHFHKHGYLKLTQTVAPVR